MGMTQAQLLGSLGAKSLLDDKRSLLYVVEGPGSPVKITGEVVRNDQPASIKARISYQNVADLAPRQVCEFQADPQPDGLYAVTEFEVGGVSYVQDGKWCFFTEADACAFVRACMLELESERVPDLDALLTFCSAGSMLISVDWGG